MTVRQTLPLARALINHERRFGEASAARAYVANVRGGTHLELECRVMRTSVMAGADKEEKGNAGEDKGRGGAES